ncbi:N-methylhydantoinase A/oxoprolinase/acetone carboxylase, beta subunit [Nonomuraea maritima]|uniref:N-methylhydantoinase A/oxoprolinase/acetone carboxylase, beta subunit n=1 Tax=Nonomuraea maritima TaxID=683260 RepID=A0A1G9EW77_9ACTN|nr:hydantoinase/oxoprolinase family protein [Nonomuraea maritima]SDK80427.1 N-methylhydantoinase A/oxoprolinase/acetone carboxylase, beta subunit [Nonomuraea maritima]
MRIGIDVGGTHTDAILLDHDMTIKAEVKTATTADVTQGIVNALTTLLEHSALDRGQVAAVMIGTTHFTNALVTRSRLARTGVVRLALPATAALPPTTAWPAELAQAIRPRVHLCHGGHEFDGRPISPLDPDELKRVAEDLAAHDITTVAISSVFSPVTAEAELTAADILRAELPHLRVSLSHQIGRIRMLERENATIVNACLRDLADEIVDGFTAALLAVGVRAPLFLSQNDGTLMDAEYTRRYPVRTFASGPTNSMRGAAFLAGLADAAVVDIGGTTADVGVLTGGYPRQAGTDVDIAGVRTNFRMPDVISIGLGGGSLVSERPTVQVGPDSVGYRLTEEALVFGGRTLTATDLAVAAGLADIGDRSLVRHLDRDLVRRGTAWMAERVAALVDQMRLSAEPLPVVVVGGGSILMPAELPGVPMVRIPEHHGVANAVGAATGQIGGEVDRLFLTSAQLTRDDVLDQARAEAVELAVSAGAVRSSVEIAHVDEIHVNYLPGNAVRVIVRAVGDLDLARTPEEAPTWVTN